MRASLSVGICLACVATLNAQSPSEILALAAESSGSKVISFADIEFEAEIEAPPMSAERADEIIKGQAAAIQAQIDAYADRPELRKVFENALAKNAEVMAKQIKEHSQRRIMGTFRMFGSGFGGDELFEVNVKRGNSDAFNIFLLQRRLDEKCLKSISFDVNSRLLSVSDDGATVGVASPVLLGRLSGFVLSLVQSGVPLECSFDESYQKKEGGELCIKFRLESKDLEGNVIDRQDASEEAGGVFGRVVVDASRGYICPLMEWGPSEDRMDTRWVCSDYFRAGSSGLWFPALCVTEVQVENGTRFTNYRFRQENVRLNETLSEQLFSIKVPVGTRVSYQLGDPQQFNAVCEFRVGIDGVDELPRNECLQGSIPQSIDGRWRRGLLYGNLILLAIGTLAYLKFSPPKKVSRHARSTLPEVTL